MAIKMSAAVRNARLDAIETAIGTAAVLKIRSGAPPTNITDADRGTHGRALPALRERRDDAAHAGHRHGDRRRR
jgi:hypothetical protein